VNSKEENFYDFCPNYVQEFCRRQKISLAYDQNYDCSVQSHNSFVQSSFLRVGSGDNLLVDER
jgi:hypothetical protein